MNNPLKYSNCWEDALLLQKALQVDGDAQIMSIASGGDNSLFLLTEQPKSLLCIDLNEIQIAVTQIKAAAIRTLDYEDFLALLGFKPSHRRAAIFKKIEKDLDNAAIDVFQNFGLTHGIIHEGKFENYFQKFALKILPWIHNKTTVEAIFIDKSPAAQADFYHKKWNTWSWRLLFKIFFSRYVMGKYGREPEKLKEVKGSVGNAIFERAAKQLSSVECQNNYILEYTLKGNFVHTLPPYAEEQAFLKIKKWLQTNQIQYHLGDLISALKKYPTCNRFNLSNIFEYMNRPVFQEQLEALKTYLVPQSRIAYWNLLVPRALHQDSYFENIEMEESDQGFFYSDFFLNIKVSR